MWNPSLALDGLLRALLLLVKKWSLEVFPNPKLILLLLYRSEDAVKLLHTPLSQRLQQLRVWYAGATAAVKNLAKQFQGAGAKVLVTADSKAFGCVVNQAHYEGPLEIQVTCDIPLCCRSTSGVFGVRNAMVCIAQAFVKILVN